MSDNDEIKPFLGQNEEYQKNEHKIAKALTEVRRTLVQCIRNMNEISIRYDDMETENLGKFNYMMSKVENMVQNNKTDFFTWCIIFILVLLCIGNAYLLYTESRDRVLFCTQ